MMERQELVSIMIEILREEGFETIRELSIENIKQFLESPLKLAEFFGWEEGVEYETQGFGVYRIVDNRLEVKISEDSWCNASVELHPAIINNFRKAKRLEEKKYYILNPEIKDCNYLQVVNFYEDDEEIFFGKKNKLYGLKNQFSEDEYKYLRENYATVKICEIEEVKDDTKI